MTEIHQDTDLIKQIEELRGELEAAYLELRQLKLDVEDSENAYEDIHQENEKLELKCQDYLDNKEFFDGLMLHVTDIKNFFEYIADECEVKPDNKHVYHTFFCEMKKAMQLFRGL
jgi:predicted nuclease with TOPRIM domain